eukprot:tig00020610_g12004.t1
MYGVPDRGGGREGKGKSLRKNKQAIEALKKQARHDAVAKIATSPAPPPLLVLERGRALVDCACNLLNRAFENDQLKILNRARSSGVEAIVLSTTDFDKLEEQMTLAKQNAGQLYCAVGIHPDAVKRTNDKLTEQRMEKLQELVRRSEAVALVCGLDFSRDSSTKYAQERLFDAQIRLAGEVLLPAIVHAVGPGALGRACELLDEAAGAGAAPPPNIAFFDFRGDASEAALLAERGAHVVMTGAVCDPTAAGEAIRAAIASYPAERVLVASNAPLGTPQSIPDAYMREAKNEPSNLPYIVEAVAGALGKAPAELEAQLRDASRAFFQLLTPAEHAAAEEAKAKEEAEAAAAEALAHGHAPPTKPRDGKGSEAAAAAATAPGKPADGEEPGARGGKARAKSGAADGDKEEQEDGHKAKGKQGGKKGKGKADEEEEEEAGGKSKHGKKGKHGGGKVEEEEEDAGGKGKHGKKGKHGGAKAEEEEDAGGRSKARHRKGHRGHDSSEEEEQVAAAAKGKGGKPAAGAGKKGGGGKDGHGEGDAPRKGKGGKAAADGAEEAEEEQPTRRRSRGERQPPAPAAAAAPAPRSSEDEDEDEEEVEHAGARGGISFRALEEAGSAGSSDGEEPDEARAARVAAARRRALAERKEGAGKGPAEGEAGVAYACKNCRRVLFGEGDVIRHVPPAGLREREHCQSWFLASDPRSAFAVDGDPTVDARLLCAGDGCGAKLGRASAGPLECSCGHEEACPGGPGPGALLYRVQKGKMDVLGAADADALVREYEARLELGGSSEEEERRARATERERRAREKAEAKKGPTRSNRANFSSFRNKDF